MIKGAAQSGQARASLVGPVCAAIGILGFSFKAILIKLAYSWAPIDPITLLTHWTQLIGAALVLSGVTLVTTKPTTA
jgi:hypothetical protein